MTTSRLFPATPGPPLVATSGNWLLGVIFSVTGGMRWLDGYFHWVPTGGDTVAHKFALWNIYGAGGSSQVLVPNSTVTSGILTVNTWNYVPLPVPIQLGVGALYCAAVGWTATNGIPNAPNQWGATEPLAAGIVNGPLTAWSALSGSNTYPASSANYGFGQGMFSNVLGADPAVAMPNNGSGDGNYGMDVLIDDTAPAGYTGSYRMKPNQTDLGNYSLDTANGFTLGMSFSVTTRCVTNRMWFYSPATVTQLPNQVGVYRVSDQALVILNASPSWSGAAGSGWVSTPMSGVLSPGVNYRAAVLESADVIWNAAVANYYSTGFGGGGQTAGPLVIPNNATSPAPGQDSYHQAAVITYPDTNVGPFDYGIDIEVTPQAAAGVTFPADQVTSSGGDLYAATWQRYPIRRYGT